MAAPDDSLIVDEPPDDDVQIGESPDGSKLDGDQARELLTTRRATLIGLGSLASIAAIAEADLDSNAGSGGSLYGGTMALDKAYKIGPRTYMGPDSAKSNVLSEIPDDEGWKYEAVDTQVDYYLDDGAWQGPQGVGSSGTKAGDSFYQSLTVDETHTKTIGANDYHYAGDYGGADADGRLGDALSAANDNDTIFLENATYSSTRTISTRITLVGNDPVGSSQGTTVSEAWTLSSVAIHCKHINFSADPDFDAGSLSFTNCTFGTNISTDQDRSFFEGCDFVSNTVTFANGTSGGLVDSCLRVSVTDNGSNTTGDNT